MSKQKLCKDCKHTKSSAYGSYYDCDRLGERNPVDGEPVFLSCATERKWFWRCGPKARFFEKR